MSIFCPELQKLLKPIYELTKKGRPFVWGDEQQKVFDEIKSRLLKPPILSMPDGRSRFLLYSDTSKDMILSDFLLMQIEDDSNLHEIIPISFNIKEILKKNYQNMVKDIYMVQTRSQAKVQNQWHKYHTQSRQNIHQDRERERF